MNSSFSVYTPSSTEYLENWKVKFLKTHPDAILPVRNHEDMFTGDSGYDVTAVEDKVIPARQAEVVNVGLKLAYLPPGLWIRIESRSGLQFKHNISAFNGIIDNSYRGDCGVRLINHSDEEYLVKKGDRVAQFVIYALIAPKTEWATETHQTQRGENGFGSSGR